MYSNFQTRQGRLGIAFATVGVYILLFFLLYPQLGESCIALSILPVAVIAWLGGIRLGLIAGLLSFPLNTALLNLVEPRAAPWAVVIQSGGGLESVAIVLIACIVGLLHDQRDHIAQELAQRQLVNRALSDSEQRYRTLFESTQRQAQELALLDRVRQALARELELPLVFRTVVEDIAQTFGYTQVSLYLVDGEVLVLQHQVGYDQVIERIPLTAGVCGQVVHSQQPALLEDVHGDPAFLGAIEGITSEVCVPLFDQGQVVGVLNVESTHGVRLTHADLRLMIALAEQIGFALGRARLYSDVRDSEQRFRQLAEHIEQVFWLEDPERSHVFYVSPAYEMIWGRTPQSLYEQPGSWFDAIHPDDRERVLAAQVRKASSEYNIEYRVIRPDGTLRWVWSRAFPIPDQHGQVHRIAGIAEDITERKVAEEALRQSNEQMREFVIEVRRRNREIALLNEMGHLLQGCQSAEEAYTVIADLSNQMFPRTAGALYLIDPALNLVSAITSWGDLPPPERTFAPKDCWALRHGKTRPLSGDSVDAQCQHLTKPLPAVSYCLPIHLQGEILGLLHLQSREKEDLDEDKRQLAYAAIEQGKMALSNLRMRDALREQSIRDLLTGLYNRRYMEEALTQQLSRVTRQLHPLGIIMIDIDHFKRFNDAYGHALGDMLLHELGHFLESNIRDEDIACRYGGEEFILIMPDVSIEIARNRAEHLRQEARQLRVPGAGEHYEGITLSLGVAIYPLHGPTIETVLRAADDALYRAKQEGRDRVIIAEKE